ncbi:hypothetical protein [Vibrio sp. NTOU-M3]|uniref:hypothetical protein n=1 Tax=unclassified Vibrio TaxID=2614977 RepID=UPI00349F0A17
MDRELLARKLYSERVSELVGNHEIDDALLMELWESKASPSEAAKIITDNQNEFFGPSWLARYLNRR